MTANIVPDFFMDENVRHMLETGHEIAIKATSYPPTLGFERPTIRIKAWCHPHTGTMCSYVNEVEIYPRERNTG